MITTNNQKGKLPEKIVASVSEDFFSYGGKFADLSETQLLKLSDALAPYYPLSDDEDSAALTLREWLTARQVSEDATQPLKRLDELATSGVREWRNVIERWFYERKYRHERRYREERYPEMLHKELYYEMKSGDPRSLIMAMQRLIEEALARNVPLAVGAPPQVLVSDGLANLAKGVVEDTRKNLAIYIERVAKAKQLLTRYLHKVVAAEGIQPKNK